MRGLRGERLRLLSAGGIGALVGEVPSRPRPAGQTLRAYHDAIVGIARHYTAVIPVRFGTAVVDDEELMFILRSRTTSFRRLLKHVRGRAQMTVRFVTRAHVEDEEPAVPAAVTGSAYLRMRAAQHRRLRALPIVRQLHAAAGQWIRDERIERRDRVVTVYHLVPRASADHYRRALLGVSEPAGLQLSGPFPPFAFADPLGFETVTDKRSDATRRADPHG
jgi:hypothetical protein